MVRDRQINEHLEAEITTTLFLKTERFINLFDNTIEISLITYYAMEATQYGLKVTDILDCCQSSKYRINVTHSSGKGPFWLSALYELRHVSSLGASPFFIGKYDVGSETPHNL